MSESLTDPAVIARNRAELHGEDDRPLSPICLLLCIAAPWAIIGFLCWALWPTRPSAVHRVETSYQP